MVRLRKGGGGKGEEKRAPQTSSGITATDNVPDRQPLSVIRHTMRWLGCHALRHLFRYDPPTFGHIEALFERV